MAVNESAKCCICESYLCDGLRAILFTLNGLQVGLAVVAQGREDQCDAMRRHTHPSQHGAKTVVQGYWQAYSHLRLMGNIEKLLQIYSVCVFFKSRDNYELTLQS